MTEELKYKVGDKVLIEAEVCTVDTGDEIKLPYQLEIGYRGIGWYSEEDIQKHIHTNLPPKPKVTQAMMDWYEENEVERADWNIFAWLDWKWVPSSIREWIVSDNRLQKEHALATLIAYGPEAVEVEKEKRYMIKIKGTAQVLAKRGNSYLFEIPNPYDKDGEIYSLANQELIDAGFEGVFDNPMFEVEEVE